MCQYVGHDVTLWNDCSSVGSEVIITACPMDAILTVLENNYHREAK